MATIDQAMLRDTQTELENLREINREMVRALEAIIRCYEKLPAVHTLEFGCDIWQARAALAQAKGLK